MAQTVVLGQGANGKVRSFWAGFGLSVITLGIYGYFWYFMVNDELKKVGLAKGDEKLGNSEPGMSVVALISGFFVIIPTFITMFRYGKRIQHAEQLAGIPAEKQINPTTAFLLVLPGTLFVVPVIVWYWYCTKHQNQVLQAVSGQAAAGGAPPAYAAAV